MNISDLVCASIYTAIKDGHYADNFVPEFGFNETLYIHNYLFNTYSNIYSESRFKCRYYKLNNDHSTKLDICGFYWTTYVSEAGGEFELASINQEYYHSGGVVGIHSFDYSGVHDRTFELYCVNIDTSRFGVTDCGYTCDLHSYNKFRDVIGYWELFPNKRKIKKYSFKISWELFVAVTETTSL